MRLTENLRTENDRYWSYLCTMPGCCRAEGTLLDVAADQAVTALAAEWPVLGSRDELAASIARTEGKAVTMRRAITRAEHRAAELLARPAPARHGTCARSELVLAGAGRGRAGHCLLPAGRPAAGGQPRRLAGPHAARSAGAR